MARRKDTPRNGSFKSDFRFEWVTWPEKKIDELTVWLGLNEESLADNIQTLCDRGWKLSVSENQQTGRYVASLTDKWGRKGCKNIAWGIEHGQIGKAILGAAYYALEVIGEGISENEREEIEDAW